MKNRYFILIALMLAFTNISALAFDKKKIVITAGYGFPVLTESGIKASLDFQYSRTDMGNGDYHSKAQSYGPIFAKFEYGINKNIGIGAVIGYSNSKYTLTYIHSGGYYDSNNNFIRQGYPTETTYKYSTLSAGARFNFHFCPRGKLDPYAGIAVGYTNLNETVTIISSDPPYNKNYIHNLYPFSSLLPLYLAATAGVRYYFTDKIGMYAELGLDKWSVVQVGIAIKI